MPIDAQEQGALEQLALKIAMLEQRVSQLEQEKDHMRDMMQRMADHAGFSHPGWGS